MNSIRGRLIALFLLVAVSAVAIVGFFAVNQSGKVVVDAALKEGRALAANLSKEIDAHLRERLVAVEMQAERDVMRRMNWAEQETSLVPLLKRYGFLDVFVADLNGDARFVDRDLKGVNIKDREYFIRSVKEKKTIVSDPVKNRAVAVDSAGILHALDKIYGATRVRDELSAGAKK